MKLLIIGLLLLISGLLPYVLLSDLFAFPCGKEFVIVWGTDGTFAGHFSLAHTRDGRIYSTLATDVTEFAVDPQDNIRIRTKELPTDQCVSGEAYMATVAPCSGTTCGQWIKPSRWQSGKFRVRFWATSGSLAALWLAGVILLRRIR